jgi:heme/copper-type cytochrome/quinol oxidase subunit 4
MSSVQGTLAPPRGAVAEPRRRLPRGTGLLGLLALFMVASIVLVHYALQVHTWQPDEVIYVTQGRQLGADFPSALWNTQIFHYGVERIVPFLGALTGWIFSDTATAMQVHKALIATAFASVTIPAYLLARGAEVAWGWALAAAALAVAVPWAALATSFLNDPVAYPAFAWAIWGTWRASAFPGWRSDLIALVTVAIAALARSNLAVLSAALVLTVLVTELRYGRRGNVRDTATGILRDHIPIVAAIALGLLYLLVRGKSGVTGVYPVDFTPPLGHLLDQSGAFFGFVAQGLVLVPVIVGSAWAFRHLIAPLDRERHALAAAAVIATVALLYTLHVGVREERYVFLIAPLLTTMMVVAVARRDVPIPVVAVSAIAVALLVHGRDPEPGISGNYLAFAYPGQGWYQNVVRGRASVYLPGSLSQHLDDILLIGIPLLVVAAMFIVRRGHRLGLGVGIALVAIQIGIGVGAAHWALDKYVNGAGDPHGPSYAARAWVDGALHKGNVGGLYAEPGPTADGISSDLRFWNKRANLIPTAAEQLAASIDKKTGKFAKPIPENILIYAGERQEVGIAGKPLAMSPTAPIQLWHITPQTHAGWVVTPSLLGWMDGPRGRMDVRTWVTCVGFSVTAPPDAPAKLTWREPGGTRVITLPASQSRVLKTTRPGAAVLIAEGKGSLPGIHVSANAKGMATVPCKPGG